MLRSSPACLAWQPKLNKRRDFTPSAFLPDFLQHNRLRYSVDSVGKSEQRARGISGITDELNSELLTYAARKCCVR